MTTTTINTDAVASESKSFDLRRFAAYFRLYLASNSRKILLAAGMVFMVTFIFQIFSLYSIGYVAYAQSGVTGSGSFDVMWSPSTNIMTFLMVVFATMSGSMLFSAVASRDTRLRTYELPASQFEKFMTWWIIYVPVFFLVTFVGFYLSDICRTLYTKAFTPFGDMAHIMSLKTLFTQHVCVPGQAMSNDSVFSICMSYYSIVTLNALFALGGIFFRRLGYLKTLAFLFAFIMLFGILFNAGVQAFFESGAHLTGRFDGDAIFSTYLFGSVTVVICWFLYTLGYARFKESEIVDRW